MKKTLIIILAIFIIILAFVGYYIYNTRQILALTKEINDTYEAYQDKEITGTTLIGIINKAIDDNEKNGVEKVQDSNLYEDNDKNSIIITVKFTEREEPVRMESIEEKDSKNFVQFFATANFKCTSIEYHSQTKQVKSLYFEQVK